MSGQTNTNVPESHWEFGAVCKEAFARWTDTDWIEEWDVKLALSDGTHLKLSRLPRPSEYGGALGASSLTREVIVRLRSAFLFSKLRQPESITALIINGVRYEVADARAVTD